MGDRYRSKVIYIYDLWIDIKMVDEPLEIYFVHVHFLKRNASVIMFSMQRVRDLEKIKHHQCGQGSN